jgi:hypothetical protein
MPDDLGKDRSWNDPARNTAKPDLEQMGIVASPHFKPQKPQIWRSHYAGAAAEIPTKNRLRQVQPLSFVTPPFQGLRWNAP